MAKNQSFGRRVWRGDRTTIAEAEKRYAQDPDRELLSYASVLYSFRSPQLMLLTTELKNRGKALIAVSGIAGDRREVADEMDMVAAYLSWLSTRHESFSERLVLRKLAWDVAERGEWVADKGHGWFEHTLLLLQLRQAQLLVDEKMYRQALQILGGVASWWRIRDTNQRARVYRSLGMLYRKVGWYYGMPSRMYYGYWFILRAIFIRKIPLNNRLKSVAAFFGISR